MEVKFIKKSVSIVIAQEPNRIIDGYYFQYEGLEFNVHKDVNSGSWWKVTEVKTGLSTNASGKTRKEAVERFEQIFNKYGKEFFLNAIESNLKRTGVAV